MKKCLILIFSAAVLYTAAFTVSAASLSDSAVDVSSGDIVSVSIGDALIEPYASYSTYYGSIGTTYVEYMRGYLSKLAPTDHYVAARVGQYDYLFAYGEDLTFNGSSFSGAVNVARWNTYDGGYFSHSYDGSFYLSAGSYLVYTDLSNEYPSLASSSDFTLRQILMLFTIFCLVLTMHSMYQVRKVRYARKRGDIND